eukprot:CAMPEP_0170480150 /NCGR_PEP_ID=MMETSP0208-20121228/1099_1 /TAXON_ID=197538 /ORGANISM="Strombidium inclinatum, Strain S3" /LENGTH=65 /DNA_ID=CAMNT_0010752649 /DNA_START=1133 /DNA_END=1330 /DNA_ORIENTATION=+
MEQRDASGHLGVGSLVGFQDLGHWLDNLVHSIHGDLLRLDLAEGVNPEDEDDGEGQEKQIEGGQL